MWHHISLGAWHQTVRNNTIKKICMDFSTLADEIIMPSQNVGHQTPNDKAPNRKKTETSTAQPQKSGNS